MVLITGADGTVGSYVQKLFPDAYATGHRKLDVSNREHVRIQLKHYDPSVIIHCAGLTSLEACEKNPKKAMLINALPSFYLTEYANDDALIIYISSAQVFGTEGGQMPEESHTVFKPINVYSQSKYWGEVFLAQNRRKNQKIVIIRTSWIFGTGEGRFSEKIIKQLQDGDEIVAVGDDVKGQPTYAGDLARFIKMVADNKDRLYEENVFHFFNDGFASKYDMATEIRDQLKMKNAVTSVDRDYFKSPVKRPVREYLSMEHTQKFFPQLPYRPWQEALTVYLNEI